MQRTLFYPWLAAFLLSMTGCTVAGPEICTNEIDDDGDGLIDCVDADCASHPLCKGPIVQQQDHRMANHQGEAAGCNDAGCVSCATPGPECSGKKK
jgi:hypothetical protein